MLLRLHAARIMGNLIKWNECYNVGVDEINQVNQGLFSLLDRIRETNLADRGLLVELKSCLEKSFQMQEGKMKENGYVHYDMHKRLHDNLLENTYTQLERELEEKDYSDDAIFHLVAILGGWIAGHVLVEDRAAFGQPIHKVLEVADDQAYENVNSVIMTVMKDMFGADMKLVNEFYDGEPVANSRGLNFVFHCGHIFDQSVIFVAENSLILHMIECISGVKVDRLSNEASGAYIEFLGHLGKEILTMYECDRWPVLQYIRPFSRDKFHIRYASETPRYSCLWSSKYGDVAIVVSED